jgi:ATP-dependent DNA helicase RecG
LDTQTIKTIIEGGESQTIEFKVQPPRYAELADRLCGLANSLGGLIIIGVADKTWEVIGVKNISEAVDTILQAARYCKPPIPLMVMPPETVEFNQKKLVVAQIPPNNGVLYQSGGVFWIRRGTHTVPLELAEVERFLYRTGHLDWETQIQPLASLNDLDQMEIKEYLEQYNRLLGRVDRIPDIWERLLKLQCVAWSTDLINGKELRPTNAGLLLFGYSPRDFFTGAEIVATYYQDNTGVRRYTDRKIIIGTLTQQIEAVEEFLRLHIQVGARIEGFRRIEEPDYSLEALREAIVNAVVHRDYSLEGEAVRVFFYTDRVEVHSPGLLLPGIDLEELRQGLVRSQPRNPVLASVMRDLPGHYMERVGSGIRFMLNQAEVLGLPAPEFKEKGGEFIVTFMHRLMPITEGRNLEGIHITSQSELPTYLKAPAFSNPKDKTLPESESIVVRQRRQELGLSYIREHGSITNKQYRELTGASENTTLRDLDALVVQGSLRALGKGRGRRYVL